MGTRQVTPADRTDKAHVVLDPLRVVVVDGDGWEVARFGPFDTLTDMVTEVQKAHPDAWFVRADTTFPDT
jgi:hypothetical protein